MRPAVRSADIKAFVIEVKSIVDKSSWPLYLSEEEILKPDLLLPKMHKPVEAMHRFNNHFCDVIEQRAREEIAERDTLVVGG